MPCCKDWEVAEPEKALNVHLPCSAAQHSLTSARLSCTMMGVVRFFRDFRKAGLR